MNIDVLREQLKIDEGCINHIYIDSLGFPTFGIGHLLKKTDPEYKLYKKDPQKALKQIISEERIRQVFEEDVKVCLISCRRLFKDFDSFLEEVKQIIANMMFNLGFSRLSNFKKFCAAVEQKNYKQAAHEMKDSTWYNQVGKRSERLVARMEKL